MLGCAVTSVLGHFGPWALRTHLQTLRSLNLRTDDVADRRLTDGRNGDMPKRRRQYGDIIYSGRRGESVCDRWPTNIFLSLPLFS